MQSASQLLRRCGYPRELARILPRTENVQVALDLGTVFHEAIKTWAAFQVGPPETIDETVNGWLSMLAQGWFPPSSRNDSAFFEYPVGLSHAGKYVPVREKDPHVYVPLDDGAAILTAGRADLFWLLDTHDPEPWIYLGAPPDPPANGARTVVNREWKTGKWPVDPAATNLQLAATGFAAADFLKAQAMRLEVYYVRDGVTDSATIDLGSSQASDLFAEVRAAAELDDTPRPSEEACGPCWERRTKRCDQAVRP